MNKEEKNPNIASRCFAVFLTGILLLVSCQLPGTMEPRATASPEIPELSSPPALPPVYRSSRLNPLDTPHTYINDTCRYLKNKWNPINAEPGTAVMIILIKNINRGTVALTDSISVGEFRRLMDQLKEQGFEAITVKQLLAFMERNTKIGPRSVLFIQSDNHDREYYENIFRDYHEDWGLTVTNGWVSDPDLEELLVRENVDMERQGLVDHQAQGVILGTTLSDDSSKVVIARELQGSVNGITRDFAKNPIAIIWPGGGFGFRPVEVARRLRFKLGFTSNQRGPVLYNWVPLANDFDPQRPTLTPEGQINDPLMTLPVYSPQEALNSIDLVRKIGGEAKAYAGENKAMEVEYYESICVPTHGTMP